LLNRPLPAIHHQPPVISDFLTIYKLPVDPDQDFDLLRAAMKKVEQDKVEVTDDCSAVEYLGMTVKLVEGDERNLKVTTPMDLKIAELLLEEMA
jgi:hypothetical protein